MAVGVIRFAEFELDRGAYQLRRKGRVVPLERIPLDLLFLLVERPGHLCTREEIQERTGAREYSWIPKARSTPPCERFAAHCMTKRETLGSSSGCRARVIVLLAPLSR